MLCSWIKLRMVNRLLTVGPRGSLDFPIVKVSWQMIFDNSLQLRGAPVWKGLVPQMKAAHFH